MRSTCCGVAAFLCALFCLTPDTRIAAFPGMGAMRFPDVTEPSEGGLQRSETRRSLIDVVDGTERTREPFYLKKCSPPKPTSSCPYAGFAATKLWGEKGFENMKAWDQQLVKGNFETAWNASRTGAPPPFWAFFDKFLRSKKEVQSPSIDQNDHNCKKNNCTSLVRHN